jgi:hypothetical protein
MSGLGRGRKRPTTLKAKLSKLQFPEICPVCAATAEDLVVMSAYVTGMAEGGIQDPARLWRSPEDKVGVALSASEGALSFWVPTCMYHGSRSVLTTKKKVTAIVVLMVLWYPLLYYALGLITALNYDRPIADPLLPFIALLVVLFIDIIYGFYPRSLERSIRFLGIDKKRDEVVLSLRNEEYIDKFVALNEDHIARVETEKNDL